MNILLIHQYFLPPNEAGSTRWNEMARHWATQGHQITVLAGMIHYARGRKYAHCRGRYVIEEQPEPGVRVVRTHVSEWYNANRTGRLWAYLTHLLSSTWAGLFRAGTGFDVVVVTAPPLLIGLTGWLLAKRLGKPLIFEVRDLWPDVPVQMGILTNPPAIWLARWLERFLYRQADHIVVLTPGYQSWLIDQKHVAADRITVIPNAADFAVADAVAATLNRADFRQQHRMSDYFWVIYAGAHGIVNRLTVVLDAADRLRDTDVRFLLIGDGTEKPALQQKAAQLGLTNVRFMAGMPKADALRFMLAADAGLVTAQNLPLFWLVFAGKMFDYFSCRVPVLMAIDGLSRQLIETANAGLFVEPENADDMARQICRYANHRDAARQHGQNGYAHARTHYDRKTLADKYLTLLHDVSTAWQTNA
jgi:glycosyltransferase involved in cell wall biosynthesis